MASVTRVLAIHLIHLTRVLAIHLPRVATGSPSRTGQSRRAKVAASPPRSPARCFAPRALPASQGTVPTAWAALPVPLAADNLASWLADLQVGLGPT
jgi:hypothetical protein